MANIRPIAFPVDSSQSINFDTPRTPIPFVNGYRAVLLPLGRLLGVETQDDVPVAPNDPSRAAVYRWATFDDWYYRIHVSPTSINLGSLTSLQTRTLSVWNAYFRDAVMTHSGVEGDAGLTLSTPVVPPVSIKPLQSIAYTLTVSPEGAAVIEGLITWTIDGVDYTVPITGRRRVMFGFAPTWDVAYSETYTWTTAVSATYSNREQRQKIARSPRRALRYTARLARGLNQLYDSSTFGWQGRFYILPIWHETKRLDVAVPDGATVIPVDTSGMSISAGSSIVLYVDARNNEMGEVLTFTPSSITLRGALAKPWAAHTKVMPCSDALPITGFSERRVLPNHVEAPVAMVLDPAAGLLGLPDVPAAQLYRDEEVYYPESDWANGIDTSLSPNNLIVDYARGRIASTRRGDFPAIGRSYRWMVKTEEQIRSLKAFFARRAGRFRPVWAPSGLDDFTLVEPIETVGVSIVVANNEYASLVNLHPAKRDIAIILRDGTVHARRIMSAQGAADRLVLGLDAGFTQGIRLEEVKRVSYLGLYRLSEDYVTFNYRTNSVAIVEADLVLTVPE